MILISSRVTIVKSLVTLIITTPEHYLKHSIKWMGLSLKCSNRLDIALIDHKLRLYNIYILL